MIPITKNLYLARDDKIMSNSAYMVFLSGELCLTTHPEYELAVSLATSNGLLHRDNRYRLTPLGKSLMKLMQ